MFQFSLYFIRGCIHFASAITTGELLNAQQQIPAPPGGSTDIP